MIIPTQLPTVAPEIQFAGMIKIGARDALRDPSIMGTRLHPATVLSLAESAGINIDQEVTNFLAQVHQKALVA